MSTLTQAIFSTAQALPEGGILSPKAFLHLASRAAIDQAMARLVKAGRLLRLARGAYASPVAGRFGARAPSTESVVLALEKMDGQTIVAHGAFEANGLGLTTQVPSREMFMTTGPSRTLRLGHRNVELKHAPHWQTALGRRPAGRAVRALSWLGPAEIAPALSVLRTQLPSDEWGAMLAARGTLPSWMARAIGQESAHV